MKYREITERWENENTVHPNLWNAIKARLRKGKFVALNAHIRKQEVSTTTGSILRNQKQTKQNKHKT